MTPLSQKCGQKGNAFKVGPHLSFQNLLNNKKHLALALKKFTILCILNYSLVLS